MEDKKGIPGSTLKIIAIVTMLIDHIGATVIRRYMVTNGISFAIMDTFRATTTLASNDGLITILYWIMRGVGRLAFPIFIFLLIEGFQYTSNKWKYLLRLFAFSIISEVPFDMAVYLQPSDIQNGKLIEWNHQNVFFTLTIGFFVIILLDLISNSKLMLELKPILMFVIGGAGMLVAWLLHTDYDAVGVLAILIMYLLRERKLVGVALMCVSLMISSGLEMTSFLILIPIAMYNGERGLRLKWIFYAFYPVHLLVLAGIGMLIGG